MSDVAESAMDRALADAQEITSGERLESVESPFRIFAGPGAGKTHWLVGHVKQTLREAERLGPSQRVACISYTSAAAEELLRRLGSAAARVDVSTIHSFLYRNVVKPYLPWVKDKDGNPLVAFEHVDGHTNYRPSSGMVNRWLGSISAGVDALWMLKNEKEKDDAFDYLSSLSWRCNGEEEEWTLNNRGYPPRGAISYSKKNLCKYKRRCWKRGILDHEDVLYFGLRILQENKGLLPFLVARYPYLYVDEFQDMTPSQTEVVRLLAGAGATTGVIGDVEQSIFVFAGADWKELIQFEPEEQRTYYIATNRRTTESILTLLNRVRRGRPTQRLYDGQDTDDEETLAPAPPTLLVGPVEAAQQFARAEVGEENLTTLTYRNAQVRALAAARGSGEVDHEAWDRLYRKELYRPQWLASMFEAIHEAQEGRYGQASRVLYQALRTRDGELIDKLFTESGDRAITQEKRRRVAASLLPVLLTSHEEHIDDLSGLAFYRYVREAMTRLLPDAPMIDITRGTLKELLEDVSYRSLYDTALLHSGAGRVKTMHKSKGEEYPAVLMYRKPSERDDPYLTLNHLLDRTGPKKDEEKRRLTYVAMSRAKRRLYICVDEATENDLERLRDVGMRIENVDPG